MGDPQLLHDVLSGDPLLLTPEEAAQVLRIGRTTIYALMKAGELRAVHIGRSCRLPRAELERYVDHLRTPPLPPPARARGRQRRTTTDQGELFDLVHSPREAR
ncbi:helix-turn-helix domain-containing protein [Geodermatophilus normandii]|uniref:Helix-turn-helix domain-containing protein n=1 Tax=Geodermatophilus normandii TaxID=1137989 RepID=A0A6P0GN53_9ACTN|nr:helix-turn-helix domain-containing protein [Geodermatophilus normandii]NEM08730.1 helix-turn-helix domain-containing protein [Geodermatophilus normandii]